MRCFYINLDADVERRKSLEENFRCCAPAHWSLTRMRAVCASDAIERGVKGAITPQEKACFLSHKAVIEANMASSEDFLVLEDDAALGPFSAGLLEQVMQSIPAGRHWDMLFLDVGVFDVGAMSRLAVLCTQLRMQNSFQISNLARLPFFGANSYVVSGKAAKRIFSLLDDAATLDEHYDHFLRQKIDAGEISAGFVFPFLTTLSPLSRHSNIQNEEKSIRDAAWNRFRTLSWHGSPSAPDVSSMAQEYGALLAEVIDLSIRHLDDHKPVGGLPALERFFTMRIDPKRIFGQEDRS